MLFKQLYRYGHQLNSHDVVKIVGITLMIIDHIGQYLLNDNPWYRMLGRGAAPLFFFLVGYDNELHVTPTLIIYGLILSFIGGIIWDHLWVNILINFIFVYLTLSYFPVEKLSPTALIIGFLVLSVMNGYSMLVLEYGFMGVLWAYSGRLVALQSPRAGYSLIAVGIVYYFWENVVFRFYLDPALLGAFTLLVALMLVAMAAYRLQSFSTIAPFRIPGLLLSRYSLAVYFYHLLFLQCLYLYIHMTDR